MNTLNDSIKEYTLQLKKGEIQKAYKGILSFVSTLKSYMTSKYPNYKSSTIYFGYMDMTYFGFTPKDLQKQGLKIAIVYLHEQNKFELWLVGRNKNIQKKYIEILKDTNIFNYRLSVAKPGVDSIIETTLIEKPDFDNFDNLISNVDRKTIEFINNIYSILERVSKETH